MCVSKDSYLFYIYRSLRRTFLEDYHWVLWGCWRGWHGPAIHRGPRRWGWGDGPHPPLSKRRVGGHFRSPTNKKNQIISILFSLGCKKLFPYLVNLNRSFLWAFLQDDDWVLWGCRGGWWSRPAIHRGPIRWGRWDGPHRLVRLREGIRPLTPLKRRNIGERGGRSNPSPKSKKISITLTTPY